MKLKKSIKWLLFYFTLFAFCLFLGNHESAKASSLQISAEYNTAKYTNALEIKLSVNSSSELTILKYASARIAKGTYFTKYEQNGTTIQKNKAGEYSFIVKENGYISVFAMNEAGEEALISFKVNNIDTEAPELSFSISEQNNSFLVTVNSKDNSSQKNIIQYVKGAYASANDTVWLDAPKYDNAAYLFLKEGKYTFLVTDEAGNSYVTIQRFGDTKESEEEFRAVWISYLDFKATGYTKKEFQAHIETMFNEVCAMNMNAVVVHVRPFGDALYKSAYFPWSRYVSGTQGKDPGFDPLEIMVEEAHKRGLEFHAWINPYRITSNSTNVNELSSNNPARIFRTDKNKQNDRNVLTYSGKLYYNPATKEVQSLIINGIKEIVTNYDVDGIHFDDYFYPSLGKNYTTNFDAPEYETYKANQIKQNKEYLSIADWRRENVNNLVRNIYSAVKAINPEVKYGISPGGFMDSLKANDKYYVDFETWLGYDGYIDYLCPQLYWSNDHSIYPFNNILNRFLDVPKNPDVKFYVGVGVYKAGIKTEGPDWYQNANVLRNMIRYSRKTNKVDGFILYGYKYLISKRDHKAVINMLKEFK